MPATIVTTEDLMEFKMDLLEKIKELLNAQRGLGTKQWLKSADLMEKLDISSGTLQTLRINGTLPYTKIGRTIYYSDKDIEELMENNKIHNKY